MAKLTNGTTANMELPTWFDGYQPRVWLQKWHNFFALHQLPEAYKLAFVEPYLEGRAVVWYRAYQLDTDFGSWTEFSCALLNRFERRSKKVVDTDVDETTRGVERDSVGNIDRSMFIPTLVRQFNFEDDVGVEMSAAEVFLMDSHLTDFTNLDAVLVRSTLPLPIPTSIVAQFEPEASLPLILVSFMEKRSLATPARLGCLLPLWLSLTIDATPVLEPPLALSWCAPPLKAVMVLELTKIVCHSKDQDSEGALQVFDEMPQALIMFVFDPGGTDPCLRLSSYVMQRQNILECNSPEVKRGGVEHQAFDETPDYQNLTLGDEDARVPKGWVEVAMIFKGGTYLGRFEELKAVGKKNLQQL